MFECVCTHSGLSAAQQKPSNHTMCMRKAVPHKLAGCLEMPHLHAQADPQVRHLVLTRILCCQDHALNTTVAKATRHQHTISSTQLSQRRQQQQQSRSALVSPTAAHDAAAAAAVHCTKQKHCPIPACLVGWTHTCCQLSSYFSGFSSFASGSRYSASTHVSFSFNPAAMQACCGQHTHTHDFQPVPCLHALLVFVPPALTHTHTRTEHTSET